MANWLIRNVMKNCYCRLGTFTTIELLLTCCHAVEKEGECRMDKERHRWEGKKETVLSELSLIVDSTTN